MNQAEQLPQKKNKAGFVIVVIGRQGSGKTPVTKRLAINSKFKKIVCFDKRNEYYDVPNVERIFYFKKFKGDLPNIKNSFIIIEEATGLIASYKEMDLTDTIIGVQHNNNVIVFIFHSVMDCPNYILRLSQYVYLLDTADDIEKVKTARPLLYPYLLSKERGKDVIIDLWK